MAEKQLKTIKFPGLPDTYVIPEGGNIDIDLKNSGIGTTTPINADTLGGFAANEYIRKNEIGNSGFENLIQINYSIVGSLTEPANPTQNMIWVETDTPIGKTFFVNNTPSETFVDGDIWIYTGNTSSVSFNALKIGDVYMNAIYPIFVKQYINGAWVNVVAKTYQDGEWVDWTLLLYDNGNEFIDITGGWVAKKIPLTSSNSQSATPSITRNADSIQFKLSGTGGTGGAVHMANKRDVTDRRTISFYGNTNGTERSTIHLSLWTEFGSNTDENLVLNKSLHEIPNFREMPVILDVSALSGEYYVGARLVGYADNQPALTFTKIEVK